MAQPHKGDRVPVLIRLPRHVVTSIATLGVADRNAYIILAILAQLEKDIGPARAP